MKKAILILSLLVAPIFCTSVMAQIKIKGKGSNISQVLPRKEVGVTVNHGDISITGHNTKPYMLIYKGFKFSDYKLIFNKTGGSAKATFTILIDGIKNEEWKFDSAVRGTRTIELNNMKGHEVVLKVENHSVANKIEGNYKVLSNSNSMISGQPSNETIVRRITSPLDINLKISNSGKGTVEVNRLAGTSSCEVLINRIPRGSASGVA